MKKRLAMTMVLAVMLCGLPALAELGTADVPMEGEMYHLVLDSVDIAEGKLTVVMEGFGDTLRMGTNGVMIAGTPEAQYGDEIVAFSTVDIAVGAPFTFTFERDSLPDAIWVQPYDDGETAVLLWQREGVTAIRPGEETAVQPTEEPTAQPTEEPAEESTVESGDKGARFAVPDVPSLNLPRIDVPDIPKSKDSGSSKIKVPEIPKVEIPDVDVPRLVASDAADSPRDTAADEPREAVPAEGAGEAEAAPAQAIKPDALLDALGENVYRQTYEALRSGEPIRKGTKGDTARGVQQTLVAFGQKIAVDGNVGPKTIAALNAVQAAFGLPETEELDAEGYAGLLPRLLVATDPEKADALLAGEMDAGEYGYMRACALVIQGKYALAKAMFEQSGWGDWESRAEACVQP